MEAAESPLDVLSRAAVMLQRDVLPPSYDEARSLSQQPQKQTLQAKPKSVANDIPVITSTSNLYYNQSLTSSGKWKREKKYQQKNAVSSNRNSPLNEYRTNLKPNSKSDSRENGMEPLDMSKRPAIKDRGEPPSYFQSILNSTFSRQQSNFASSVTRSPGNEGSSILSNDDKETMCDQVINEHFRRSLGQDYLNVFSGNRKQEQQSAVAKTQDIEIREQKMEKCSKGRVSPSPLSVDDHFAKALGDTWIKLQQREKDDCNESTKHCTQRANEE